MKKDIFGEEDYETVGDIEEKISVKSKDSSRYKPMTIGDWLIVFLIQFVPVIGILVTLFWAISRRTQPSKRTWAQALLVLYFLIGIMVAAFYSVLWGFLLDIFSF